MKNIKIIFACIFAIVTVATGLDTNSAMAACLEQCLSCPSDQCTKYSTDKKNCPNCCTECPTVACTGNKVWDTSTSQCVCPQRQNGMEPLCPAGSFNDETCQCDVHCYTGYYQDGDTCQPCPDDGTTKGEAIQKSECYVTTFEDDTGSGNYTDECHWNDLVAGVSD